MLQLEKYARLFNRSWLRTSALHRSANALAKTENIPTSSRCSHTNRYLSKQQVAIFNREQNAVFKLLARSIGVTHRTLYRHIHSGFVYAKDSKDGDNAAGGNAGPPKQSKKSTDNENEENNNKKNDQDEKIMSVLTKTVLWMLTIYLAVAVVSMMLPNRKEPETTTRYVSWHEFVHQMVVAGEVKELIVRPDLDIVTIILHDDAVIKGKKMYSSMYHMAVADISKFETKLRDVEARLGISEGIPIMYERSNDVLGKVFITLVIAAVFISLMSRMKGMKSPISMDGITQMARAKFTLVDPHEGGKGVLFKDVAGLQEAKQEVMEFVDYLKTPQRYQKLGAKVPKGALLLGPPGCGKTLLAKAVATEAQVPFLSMNGSEFIEMIGGLGAARVRDLFKEAKKRAPCIIYIDEIDGIGRQRASAGGSQQFSSGESEQTLNQLLVEMDGMASKEGVLMLASTNRAEVLDKALLRPGRFDRHILIDLPNLSERREIFEKHLSGISLEHAPSTYSGRLATLTPGFSGADIANVCNEAALHAARSLQKVVRQNNLEYAVERLVGGTEKRSHALSLTERKVIAYHESGHALVGWMLPTSDILLKVTIVPRTSMALGFAQYTPKEQKLFTKEELFDKMCMALGGRAAENLVFSRITTGAQNDLEKVTNIAYAQVKKFGMSNVIGPMYIHDETEVEMTADKPYSKSLGNLIDQEAGRLVAAAYNKTEEILRENSEKLEKLAKALLEKETLNYDDVVLLIGPPPSEATKKKIEPVEFEDSLNSLSKT